LINSANGSIGVARPQERQMPKSDSKTIAGNFFEDFRLGQKLVHATPRTMTAGDGAVYMSLYGPRFAVQSADSFAAAIGYPKSPLDDLLVFHTVFGKTVPDVSLNAVANLGYAQCRFLAPVYAGDTLATTSEVIGLKENSNKETGVVYVRSTGRNQAGAAVLDYVRWVMVRKRDKAAVNPDSLVPPLAERVDPATLGAAVPPLQLKGWDNTLAGSRFRFNDYAKGERIDHADGMTIEEAEHQMATRLYQNTAKVHFNQHTEGQGRFGRRLVYGGVVISLVRALSFNGLGNAFHIAAINGGRHVAPAFAGDTIYAWSEILETAEIPGRADIGLLRVRHTGLKNRPAEGFPATGDGVVLDLDVWLAVPK
jgi:2-methylfumaryl-CoA hydratase